MLCLGLGTAMVSNSGTDISAKHKKHHHHNKRVKDDVNPTDTINGNNSTSAKDNDA